jgi:aspartate-semialdehyde dehydrogenase
VVSIVGGGSLLGRELRDVLSTGGLRVRTKLIGADEGETGTLTEEGGEPLVMTALDEDNLSGSEVVFLAGSLASSSRTFEIISGCSRRPALIDLTGAFEDRPSVRLRAPMVEPPGFQADPEALHVMAHPAAIVLALFLARLQEQQPLRRAVVLVFEPASERGRRGLDELQQQTINLLTFKNLPKAVFDEQLGFNLLAQYGSQAPEPLEKFERRIERHLASLLALSGRVPMPSIRLIQAPVFHGHSFSIWVEFDEQPDTAILGQALASGLIDVRGADLDAPTIMGIAGQSGLAVGAIRADPNDPRAGWFWVVADNLRITAENAVAVARSLMAEGRAGNPA